MEIKFFEKHKSKVYILILALILVFYIKQTETSTFRDEWFSCVDFLAKGELYTGHPHCQEGPVLFIIGLIFKSIFGTGTAFHASLKVFILLLTAVMIYLAYRVIRIETEKRGIFMAAFLFIIWLYLPLISNNFDKSLTVVFPFFGFYLLYYSKIRFREVLAGLFFSLSIFSSIQSAIIPLILLAYYPFETGFVKIEREGARINAVKINPKKILSIVLAAFPILIISAVLLLIFPNLLAYSLFAHSLDPEFTLRQLLPLLIPKGYVSINLFFAYLVLAFSFYLFYVKRNVIPLAGGISLAAIMFTVAKTSGGFLINRYTIPTYPFIILTLVLLKDKIKDKNYMKIAFAVIISMLIVFPGFEPNPVSHYIYDKLSFELENFKKEIGYGIHFMSPQKGRIMVEYPELLTRYDYRIEPKKTEVVSEVFNTVNIDERVGPRLIKLKIADMSKWKMPDLISDSEEKQREFKIASVKERLKAENYSMLVVGPNMQEALIYQGFMALDDAAKSGYCRIIVPNAEHHKRNSRHTAMVLMDNMQNCRESFQRMVYYYSAAFDDICKKSRFAANNIVNGILQMNGVALKNQCVKGGNFIEDYNEYVFFPFHIITLLTSIIIIMILGVPFLLKRGMLQVSRHKAAYYGTIAALAILAAIVFVKTSGDSSFFLEIAKNI